MATFQSTYNRDLHYQLLAKLPPSDAGQFGSLRGAATSMGLSTDNSGLLPGSYATIGAGNGKMFLYGETAKPSGFGGLTNFPGGGAFTPGANGKMITQGTLAGPTGSTSGDLGIGNCAAAHTVGSASYSLSKAWVSDQVTTIYQVGIYSNYANVFFSPGWRLLWVQALPVPLALGIGDSFTLTIVISL